MKKKLYLIPLIACLLVGGYLTYKVNTQPEHIVFKTSYLIAALACVLLISGYGRSILDSWKAGFTLMTSYSALYVGMYQLLASEDYAFMLGAWLMFGALAFFMFLTRRLNWYQVDQKVKPVLDERLDT